MKLESVGILIGLRPFNERDALARVFTRDYGVVSGMMRAALVARKNKPLIGQVGQVDWLARLDSQLGVFHWDATKNLTALLMMSGDALCFVNAVFDLLSLLLPERESYRALYDKTLQLFQELQGDHIGAAYLSWEMALLQELGFALDLSRCSGCGARTDLNYLSPRTGRAVCDNCAVPYLDKLYKLPINLNTTRVFLDKICATLGAQLPLSRCVITDKE